MRCSANRQIMDNSFRWRIEEIVRERQHQLRHNRTADHRWRLVSSSCQPGPQIFDPQTNYKVQYGGTCLEREAAAEYDRAFSHVTRYFVPFVLRAARVAPGMRVLDIAAGTGLSAALSARSARPALRRARSAVCSGGDLSIFSEFFHPAFRTSSRLLSDYCCLDSLAVKKQA